MPCFHTTNTIHYLLEHATHLVPYLATYNLFRYPRAIFITSYLNGSSTVDRLLSIKYSFLPPFITIITSLDTLIIISCHPLDFPFLFGCFIGTPISGKPLLESSGKWVHTQQSLWLTIFIDFVITSKWRL